MHVNAPSLGLLPPAGGSLSSLAASGQVGRFIDLYLRGYAGVFREVRYFSYVAEELARYTSDPLVLDRVRVVPGPHRTRYGVRLSLLGSCEVLRVFQLTGALPAMLARARWGTPFAVTYGYDYARAARVQRRPARALAIVAFERVALRAASAVFATTPALLARARRAGAEQRAYLLPNAVDTDHFRPGCRRADRPTVVFVGRLEPQKNLTLLLEAAARIRSSPRVVLVGAGSQREQLASAAAERNVDLELRGVLPYEVLPAALAEGWVFALPSHWEGHPKALLEAMSCGLACVAADRPGARDVVRHEDTGLLAAAEPRAFASALERLLVERDLAERLGGAARDWVEANCSARAILPRELAMLLRLARDGR